MTADRDERLAALIDRAAAGADLAPLAAENPDLAAELRELWAVAQVAGLARSRPAPARAAEPAPPPPRQFGDFELGEELGRGGMGVVYKARQASLGRVVALKMVREAHLASDADRERFRREGAVAAAVKHPNIVTVYDRGISGGIAYICMEYVEGRTLAQEVARRGAPFAPREAARVVADVARAVGAAHAAGVFHRDLKPSNILLAGPESNPVPKVTDFGLAKRKEGVLGETLTRPGDVVGTPSYMAPEQASGKGEVDARSDVYSLGAVLYELLTKRPPFQASNPVDTIFQVIEQEPVPPRDLNPSVPRELELVCLKCLQKPPELRYATADGLAADLDAFGSGGALSVEPGNFGSFVSRMLRETHHAAVLENWGLLWMWHSGMIFFLCLLTQLMAWWKVESHGAYLAVWGTGLLTWGTIFWRLRRSGGPVLFVERQIAHAWAGSVAASIALFVIEVLQGLPSLTLSPVLAVVAGMVFLFKAGTLSGRFYLTAAAFFVTAGAMAAAPSSGHLLFGAVSACAFFFPGLKYYRQRKRGLAVRAAESTRELMT